MADSYYSIRPITLQSTCPVEELFSFSINNKPLQTPKSKYNQFMSYSYNKSVLETAGYNSLEPSGYGNRSPQKAQINTNEQPVKDDKVSFARNFKMRLFEGDPQQQRSREALKDNYKRQLEQQMAENKRRKELEKKKLDEEDLKHQRAFYSNAKQVQGATKQDQGQYPQKKRAASEKSIGSLDLVAMDRDAPRPFNLIDGILGRQLSQAFPSLLQQQRSQRPQKQTEHPFKQIMEYTYEDQRMVSIQEFQSSIIRKMEGIRDEIQSTDKKLYTKLEFDRIKNLLQKQIVPFQVSNNDSIRFYDVHGMRKREVEVPRYQSSINSVDNTSGQYQRLDGKTQVKYPENVRASSAQPNFKLSPHARPQKSQSSGAEDEEYDQVQVPDLPPKFKKVSQDSKSSFATKPYQYKNRDASFDRAKFVPKTDIIDYKIDNMLSNIDNLIAHYDKE